MKNKERKMFLVAIGLICAIGLSMPMITVAAESEDMIQYSEISRKTFMESRNGTVISGVTLSTDVTIQGDAYMDTGTFKLNGYTLTIEGNLYHTGGDIIVGTGTLEVDGNYIMAEEGVDYEADQIVYNQAEASLLMRDKSGVVKIGGNFVTCSSIDHYSNLTAGTMYIGGDFTQVGTEYSFKTSKNHTVVLNGTGEQVISFEDSNSYFTNLKVSDNYKGTIMLENKFQCSTLLSDIKVNIENFWGMEIDVNLNGKTMEIMGNARINSGSIQLDGGLLKVDGDLYHTGEKISVGTGTLEVSGELRYWGGEISVGTGTLKVGGDLHHNGGGVFVDKGIMDIGGDYIMAGQTWDYQTEKFVYTEADSWLSMVDESAVVKIGGDFVIYSNKDHSDNLSAGTMYIGGDFTQIGPFLHSFTTSGNHTVVLNGTEEQVISIDDSDSYFTNLKVSDNYEGTIILKKFRCSNLLSDIKVSAEECDIVDVNLNGKTMEIIGNATIDYGSIQLEGGLLKADGNLHNGASIQLEGGLLKVDGNLYHTGEKISVGTGIVEVGKNLYHTGGGISVDTGIVDVIGKYIIAEETLENGKIVYNEVDSWLSMVNEDAVVKVGGNFVTCSNEYHVNRLTAGTMYIGGDFTQKGYIYNFSTSGSHTVVLNGTGKQIVSFEGWKSGFTNLKLTQDISFYEFSPSECWKNLEMVSTTPITNPFIDVSDSMYYYQPVLWALENNVTAGISATQFAPEQSCTRGQVVTFLWRAMGCPEPSTTTNPFVDVNSNEYYYKAVLWALENGITAGTDATHFAPNDTVTRGQFVTFLHRAENKPSYSVSNPFSDVPNTYYYDAVLWAYENGVTAGINATEFAPEQSCTRGQVVTFLYRALNDK